MRWPVAKGVFGAICTKDKTRFRVYAPLASEVRVLLYEKQTQVRRREFPMQKNTDGTHEVTVPEDLHGRFYLYLLDNTYAVTDPYSVAVSMNSTKSAVIDLNRTHPMGWERHAIPKNSPKEAIVYELHVKDYTGDLHSGALYRGKFLGLVEGDTKFGDLSTGLSHLEELGVTHVHLMPVQDFISVREDPLHFFDDDNYNWGYDPEHFNAAEGSYVTDPKDPVKRVKELKMLIMALHERGISVVLDVVYNHTFRSYDSNFEMLAPGYYHRRFAGGAFSDGSGCGNEFASEKPMGRKFILDSIGFWMEVYKVDGFRFDLMSLIDRETVDQIVSLAQKINPHVLLYGEPWAAARSALPHKQMVWKGTQKNKGFALFNDDFRNALRGGNDDKTPGYVQGNYDNKQAVETGITGSIRFSEGRRGFTAEPEESINYFNSHDNLIIADKLALSSHSKEDAQKNGRLLFSILMTSFGIPFFHAGNEFQRSKQMEHNSYRSPLSVNGIRWEDKKKHQAFYHYVRDCITLRKMLRVFSEYTAEDIRKNLSFFDRLPPHIIGYRIREKTGDSLWIFHNAGEADFTYAFPDKGEKICLFDAEGIRHQRMFSDRFTTVGKSTTVHRVTENGHE